MSCPKLCIAFWPIVFRKQTTIAMSHYFRKLHFYRKTHTMLTLESIIPANAPTILRGEKGAWEGNSTHVRTSH